MAPRVTVVGAGVLGLSCAVRLAEHGVEVNVLARELPRETFSAAASGLWLPPAAEPVHAVRQWARETLDELRRLAGEPGAHGVRLLPGTLLHPRPVAEPVWARPLADIVRLTAVTEPAPGYAFGHRTELPVVDVPLYLDHLAERLRTAGGTVTRLPLTALPTRGIVVNCTGVAARALARDPDVRPVRGQSVLVADPGLDRWWYDGTPGSPTFVVPRGRDVVIGGTAEDGDWGTTPDADTARLLLERAARVVPQLRDATVLGHRVGLRPARPTIRVAVEPQPTDDDPNHVRVHCYGHGDGGLALGWGSAGTVCGEVLRVARELQPQG
jgi:D-amino-acid oxidase